MQQLQEKLKNVPTDAPQVCSSTSSLLNKDESPSAKSGANLRFAKLSCNTPEGNLLQHTGGQALRVPVNVYVLSMRGFPLMPTSPGKARKLVSNGKAKVVKRFPFTIKMLVPTGESKEEITLGIDSGYKKIGFSCVSEKNELMSGEFKLEDGTQKRLVEKRMYRRLRRAKLWYREPRFDNRKKGSDWLPPSVRRRYEIHLLLVEKVKKLLPITKVIVEVGNFDIQKIDNPDIQNSEYQQGGLYESNLKSFVISREHGKCQFCSKEKGNDSWRFHHIIGRKDGGTDRSDNIALLHLKCHDEIHKKHLEHLIKKNKWYKAPTFMNIVKNKFQKDFDCEITYGYITHKKLIDLNLEKTHANDAFVIANGKLQKRCLPIQAIQKRKNNRCLQLNRKGSAPSIRRQRSKYQPNDLVKINNENYNVVGMFNYGKWIRVKKFGDEKLMNFSIKNIQSGFSYNGLIFKPNSTINEIVELDTVAIHPPPEGGGSSCDKRTIN